MSENCRKLRGRGGSVPTADRTFTGRESWHSHIACNLCGMAQCAKHAFLCPFNRRAWQRHLCTVQGALRDVCLRIRGLPVTSPRHTLALRKLAERLGLGNPQACTFSAVLWASETVSPRFGRTLNDVMSQCWCRSVYRRLVF